MDDSYTVEQARAAQVISALEEAEGRRPDPWIRRVANSTPVTPSVAQGVTVTPGQVDNAKLLLALDRADGHESDEWIVRLANAKVLPGW